MNKVKGDLVEFNMLLFFTFLSAFWGGYPLLLPQSEAVLAALLLKNHSAFLLILIATFEMYWGSCINWWLGLKIEQFKHKKWFSVSKNV